MPLYVYRCEDCTETLEVLVRGLEPRLCGHRCPSLGEHRGSGLLTRIPALTARPVTEGMGSRERPTDADVARVGFSTYQNVGTGFERRAGEDPKRRPS